MPRRLFDPGERDYAAADEEQSEERERRCLNLHRETGGAPGYLACARLPASRAVSVHGFLSAVLGLGHIWLSRLHLGGSDALRAMRQRR